MNVFGFFNGEVLMTNNFEEVKELIDTNTLPRKTIGNRKKNFSWGGLFQCRRIKSWSMRKIGTAFRQHVTHGSHGERVH